MAPDATLIGYSAGDAIAVFSVLAAFDDILAHQRPWNIKVVSNSWGSPPRMFDPNDPVNVATRTLHDAGMVVVFAAGNDGGEMTMNPYSAAPWVIIRPTCSLPFAPAIPVSLLVGVRSGRPWRSPVPHHAS